MKVLKAQTLPKREIKSEDLLTLFCLYFPQYKYHEARLLPYKRLIKMLTVAQKQEARKYYELTQIAAAPHTKKGSGVKKLLDRYKKVIG